MIDILASETHFIDHLTPIWAALDADERGTFYTPAKLAPHAERRALAVQHGNIPASDRLTLVASWGDLLRARRAGRWRCIYSEHGAGQSYTGLNHGSYIGSPDRAGVVAVLVPGEEAAERHRRVHPTIPAYPVGCPRLDWWQSPDVYRRPRSDAPTVGISFHWNCALVPETKSAYPHFAGQLKALKAAYPNLLGHGHPRIFGKLARHYTALGIEPVADFVDILERADVYGVDNSSTLFEFASTGRPVVVLNAPRYRRNINHGMRFWDYADIGPNANRADELIDSFSLALADSPELQARRAAITEKVYAVHDGTATSAAVHAVRTIAYEWGARCSQRLTTF